MTAKPQRQRNATPPLQVTPHIHLVGDGERTAPGDCCIYALTLQSDPGRFALIDAGVGREPSHARLVANLATIGLMIEHCETLVLTHGHIDHIGGAAAIKGVAPNCTIIAHEADRAAIEGDDMTRTAASWYNVTYRPVTVDRVLTTAPDTPEEIVLGARQLHVEHIPGHTPGSIALWLDDEKTGARVLFGQDIHGPFDPSFGSDIDAWRGSMHRLLALEADILCEGHFGVVRPAGAVRRFIERYLGEYANG